MMDINLLALFIFSILLSSFLELETKDLNYVKF